MSNYVVLMAISKEPSAYFKPSVESILNQSHRDFDFGIIIDDPTNLEAINYLHQLKEKDSRIHLYKNVRPVGLTSSLIKLIDIFDYAKFYFRMDADDISLENRFEKQIHFIEGNDLDLVFSNVDLINEEAEILASNSIESSYLDNPLRSLLKVNKFAHSTLLIKGDILRKYSYNVALKFSQDYDLWIRLAIDELRFGIVPDRLVQYRVRTIKDSKWVYRRRMDYQSNLKVLLLNFKAIKYEYTYYKAIFVSFTKLILLCLFSPRMINFLIRNRAN